MATEKSHIIATLNGIPQGYVKSVSYTKGEFTLCKNKVDAKGYTKLDKIHYDIDFLTKYYYDKGYIFMYD